MKRFIYPTSDKIIELNMLVLTMIRVKKSDRPKVLSKGKIDQIVEGCKLIKGEIYTSSRALFKNILLKVETEALHL